MKKLTIEIPDWAEGKQIHVFIAKESYMHVGDDGTVYRKTVRCDRCGKCCRMHPDGFWIYPKYEIDEITYCVHCEKRPNGTFDCMSPVAHLGCCTDNPSNRKHKGKGHTECCIEYEKLGLI